MRRLETKTLAAEEWQTILSESIRIAHAGTHENVRMLGLRALRELIPYQSAAFFLISPKTRAIIDCIIIQPLGENLSSADFEQFIRERGNGSEGLAMSNTAAPQQTMTLLCNHHASEDDARSPLANCHTLICNLAASNGAIGSFALARTARQGAFSEHDKLIAETLAPHLANELNAFYQNNRFEVLSGMRLKEVFNLTNREIEVTECVIYGMTTPEIARKLGIRSNTAKKHLENIYKKTGVNNRMSLMKLAQTFLSVK